MMKKSNSELIRELINTKLSDKVFNVDDISEEYQEITRESIYSSLRHMLMRSEVVMVGSAKNKYGRLAPTYKKCSVSKPNTATDNLRLLINKTEGMFTTKEIAELYYKKYGHDYESISYRLSKLKQEGYLKRHFEGYIRVKDIPLKGYVRFASEHTRSRKKVVRVTPDQVPKSASVFNFR